MGYILFHCDTQYDTDQTAVSTIHMITIKTSVVWSLSAEDGRDSGEGIECKLYIIIIQLIFYVLYIVLYMFRFKINTLLCYTLVSVLAKYYWILGALFGIVLTLLSNFL